MDKILTSCFMTVGKWMSSISPTVRDDLYCSCSCALQGVDWKWNYYLVLSSIQIAPAFLMSLLSTVTTISNRQHSAVGPLISVILPHRRKELSASVVQLSWTELTVLWIAGAVFGVRSFAPILGFVLGAWTNSKYVDLSGTVETDVTYL